MKNRFINRLFTEENIICFGCAITFAALVIQFIIVSTN